MKKGREKNKKAETAAQKLGRPCSGPVWMAQAHCKVEMMSQWPELLRRRRGRRRRSTAIRSTRRGAAAARARKLPKTGGAAGFEPPEHRRRARNAATGTERAGGDCGVLAVFRHAIFAEEGEGEAAEAGV